MTNEAIQSWIQKSKDQSHANPKQQAGVTVIRTEPKSKGAMIMDLADRIRPGLMKMFEGVRGDDNMLLAPATIRGYALNVAQELLKTFTP